MNILIKLMSIVSLVIAPSLAQIFSTSTDVPAVGMMHEKIESPVVGLSMYSNDDRFFGLAESLHHDGFYTDKNKTPDVNQDQILIYDMLVNTSVFPMYESYLSGIAQ